MTDTDPQVAALIANAMADELIRRSPASGASDPEQQVFIRSQMADLQDKIEAVSREIERLTAQMATLTSAAEIKEIQDRIAALETVKTTYQARYADFLQLYNPESPNLLSLFDAASPPSQPIPGKTWLIIGVAGVSGLALAVAALILMDYLDTSIRWENDTVQASLGLPILGAIPQISRRQQNGGPLHSADIPILSESIHGIQTQIFFAHPNRSIRTLLVTSPGAQEGKSFVLAHLAMALTEAGYRVVVADVDLRRPSLHEFFEQPNVIGVANLLDGQRNDLRLSEMLRPVRAKRLWFLPAGRTSVEPALLVGSRRFRAFLDELQQYADVVLLDSPPVLGPPEAALLASMADATLLVVDDGITSHTAARKARDRLMGQEGVNLLGVVFNRVKASSHGYGYAYYGKDQKRPRRRKERAFLTLAEAADRLGVSKKTARHWCQTGKLPARRVGLWWRIRPEDVEKKIAEIISTLEKLKDPRYCEGMARFAITPRRAYGVPVPKLRRMAKEIGKNHELAVHLWTIDARETRLLAALLDNPHEVTEEQMDTWAADFDNWEICDQVCQNLFVYTPWVFQKCREWVNHEQEFVKRAAFVLMACLAVKDHKVDDRIFEEFLSLIHIHSLDERLYVKKAVNWALRQIGKRNSYFQKRAIATALEIQKRDSRGARWIAADALRELQSDGVRVRLQRRENQL